MATNAGMNMHIPDISIQFKPLIQEEIGVNAYRPVRHIPTDAGVIGGPALSLNTVVRL